MLMDECGRNCTVVADGRFDLRVVYVFWVVSQVFCLGLMQSNTRFWTIPFQQQCPLSTVHHSAPGICNNLKFLLTGRHPTPLSRSIIATTNRIDN
jgi:hypothetical protein